jgi:shikimate dehydrogenase
MIGLLGKNIDYSYSPEIHNVVLYKNGQKADYQLFNREQNELETFFANLRSNQGRCNVTVPYKLETLKHLDKVMGIAKLIGVNSVKEDQGLLIGINTDIMGFQAMIDYYQIELQGKEVVILGNGASSKMVQIALTGIASKVQIVSLTPNANEISYKEVDGGDIVINTTPVGSGSYKGQSPLTEMQISKFSTLIDLAYNPFSTKLLIEGRLQGKETYNSLYMLVSQALHAEEFFYGINYSEELVEKIYKHLKTKHTNLVLIGMPGVGKTTLAYQLSNEVKAKVIDIDAEIIEREQTTVEKLFEESEQNFRTIESEITKEIADNENSIISCGGGIVLNKENMRSLMEKGIIVFLNRDVSLIEADLDLDSRPLLNSFDDWMKTYEQRIALYPKYADHVVFNNEIESSIVQLKEIWRK